MIKNILCVLASIGLSITAKGGGHGTVFSVPTASESNIESSFTDFTRSNGISLNDLSNRQSLAEIAGEVEVAESIIVEGAKTVSRYYLGHGSTFAVDWDNETVRFEDDSSADFEQVVDEALDIMEFSQE